MLTVPLARRPRAMLAVAATLVACLLPRATPAQVLSTRDAAERTQLMQRLAAAEAARDTTDIVAALEALGEFHTWRDTAEARRHLVRAIAIREATSGASDLSVAYALERLARLGSARAPGGDARMLLERIVPIAEAAAEESLLERTLEKLADLEWMDGKREDARALFVRRVGILESQLAEERRDGDDTTSTTSDILEAVDRLATVSLTMADYTGALPFLQRVMVMRRASGDTDERNRLHVTALRRAVALSLAGDSSAAQAARAEADAMLRGDDPNATPEAYYGHVARELQVDGAEAAAKLLYAWSARVAPLGDLSRLTLTQLDTLFDTRYSLGRNEDALAIAKRRVEVAATARGVDAQARMNYMRAYADLLATQGQYGEARVVRDGIVTLAEREYGPATNGVASELESLAKLTYDLGDYAAARGYAARALAITRVATEPNGPLTTDAMRLLARAQAAAGEREAARSLFEEALRIDEQQGHELVDGLVALGTFLAEEGALPQARELLERAVGLARDTFDPSRTIQDMTASWIIYVIGPFADVLAAQGDFAAASAQYQRAIRVGEGTLGPWDAQTSSLYARLGTMLLRSGDAGIAAPALERALEVAERVYGSSHPEVATRMLTLADLRAAQGDRLRSDSLVLQASRILDRYARTVLPTLSPGEQRAFVTRLADANARLLSEQGGIAPAEAYRFVGGWKGVLLHGLRRQVAIGHLRSDPVHAADVARLQAVRAGVAHHFQRAGKVPSAEWTARNDSLTAQKEQLERTLARALPDGASDDPWTALGDGGLHSRLPAETGFVDIHRHAVPGAEGDAAHRYTAVLSTSRGVTRIPLGTGSAIDTLVTRWREAVIGGGTAEAEMASLRRAVWASVEAALAPGITRIWVSADAQLARVPWSVIAQGDGAVGSARLVAEVASPRALAQLFTMSTVAAAPGASGVLLVGGVDFDTGRAASAHGNGWSALPGTQREVEALAALAAQQAIPAQVVTGQEATPSRIAAALAGSRYAHLATHGFFFRESAGTYGSRGLGIAPPAASENAATAAARNPLAESGLALAGANAGPEGNLTAEELLGIDLSRVSLVVLSACETGRGTEITGQGVMGLRASFEAAGVGALVMSLWKVPDASTALLMESFYRALWVDRLPPAAALRKAQDAVRADARFAAPVHWAAWVVSGEGWGEEG